jgi:hypothetical protein
MCQAGFTDGIVLLQTSVAPDVRCLLRLLAGFTRHRTGG